MLPADREVWKCRIRLPHYDDVKGSTSSTGGQWYGVHGVAQCPGDPEWSQMHPSTQVGSTLILGGQRPCRRWLGHVKRVTGHTFGGDAGGCLRVELLSECGRWTGAAGQTLLRAVWSGLLQGHQSRWIEWLAAPRVVGGGQFEVLGTLLAQTLSSRLNPNEKWHLWPAAGLHWRLVYPWL